MPKLKKLWWVVPLDLRRGRSNRTTATGRSLHIEVLEPRLALSSIPFSAPLPITSTADGPSAVFAADLDRDGDLDVLTASANDNTVAWFANLDGAGTFGPAQVISSTADGASAVQTADLDRDGDLDVLIASANDDTIAWHENTNGLGVFGSEQQITTTADGASDVVAADLDRDGDFDVLAASSEDNTVRWYENTDGAGSLTLAQTITSSAAGVRSVFAADIDGDGDLDILSASPGNNTIAWYENTDGGGTFGPDQVIAADAMGARSVFAADLDGDGDLDVLAASYDDDTIAWYENSDGAGTFAAAQPIDSSAGGAAAVYARDMDRDGDQDVLAASASDDTIAWYENSDGAGGFGPAQIVSAAADRAAAVYPVDLDRDGNVDVLSAAADADTAAWYRNETIHRSAKYFDPYHSSFPDFFGPTFVATADFDGDGDLDGLYAFAFLDRISWAENTDGSGTIAIHIIAIGPDRPTYVGASDLDRDGDPDVIVAAGGDDEIIWYENTDGEGNFGPRQLISNSEENPVSVEANDIDGDGDQDIVATGFDSNSVAWYENADGSGSFGPQQVISSTTEGATTVYTADLDSDGDPEVISAAITEGTVAWFENNGDGTFDAEQLIDGDLDGATSVHAGDLDGDGDMDVLASSWFSSTVAWYENLDGQATFGTRQVLGFNADDGYFWVRAADIDADGDLDVVWARSLDGVVEWRENLDGAANFGPPQLISSRAFAIQAFDVADFDGDGDLDILPANFGNDGIVWYENRGGQFALETTDTALAVIVEGRADDVLQIDMVHRGRVGDHDEELVSLALMLEEDEGDPLASGEANALVDMLEIYRDDGSGSFEPDADTLVASVETLELTDGLQTVTFTDGDPNVQVAFASPATFFVVVRLTPDATDQPVTQFRVTHVTEGPTGSTAEDAEADIPITLEFPTDVSSTIVQAGKLGDMDRDGDLDLDDVEGFVLGLTETQDYADTYGLPSSVHGDIDGDGDHDLDDVDPFVDLLVGGQGGQGAPGAGSVSQPDRAASAQASNDSRAVHVAETSAEPVNAFGRPAADAAHAQRTDAALSHAAQLPAGVAPSDANRLNRPDPARPWTRFASRQPSMEAQLAAVWRPGEDWLRRWFL